MEFQLDIDDPLLFPEIEYHQCQLLRHSYAFSNGARVGELNLQDYGFLLARIRHLRLHRLPLEPDLIIVVALMHVPDPSQKRNKT